MKLLFIIHSLKFGGTERQLIELVKGLDKNHYKIHIICLEHNENRYRDIDDAPDISIIYFSRSYKYDVSPIKAICKYIINQRIDLIHTFESLGSLFGLFCAKFTKRPIVCSAIRDAKDKNLKLKISKRLVAMFSDIVVSNSFAGFHNRFHSIRPNFRVIYNGMDFRRFLTSLKTDQKNRDSVLGASDFKHIVGMIASLTDRKDHDTLLEAAPEILSVCPGVAFLIIGDGPEKNRLVKKCHHLGLDRNVIFTGYRQDVDEIYKILDISVLLSNSDIHFEGISNAIIEALANGVPVVASSGGGTDEVITHNLNGILVTPKNKSEAASAIIDLIQNREKAEKLAAAGKIFAERTFGLDRYVELHEKLYQETFKQFHTKSAT